MEFQYGFYSVCIMAGIISFLGFCLENVWLAVTKGYMDNRGMKHPFLLGYGGLVLGMYMLLGTPEEMALLGIYKLTSPGKKMKMCYFLAAAMIVSIGEIILGYAVKLTCGMDYWNYTWIPLHITPYTSIPTSTGFGLIITGFMDCVFTPLMGAIEMIPDNLAKGATVVLRGVMIPDFIRAFKVMKETGKPMEKWRLELPARKRRLRLGSRK
ncbi:MAG: putative ABC transporter permease [Ruminococcus sp.]|nr:putative ABC transporter permease [Ruminococcus sp.]